MPITHPASPPIAPVALTAQSAAGLARHRAQSPLPLLAVDNTADTMGRAVTAHTSAGSGAHTARDQPAPEAPSGISGVLENHLLALQVARYLGSAGLHAAMRVSPEWNAIFETASNTSARRHIEHSQGRALGNAALPPHPETRMSPQAMDFLNDGQLLRAQLAQLEAVAASLPHLRVRWSFSPIRIALDPQRQVLIPSNNTFCLLSPVDREGTVGLWSTDGTTSHFGYPGLDVQDTLPPGAQVVGNHQIRPFTVIDNMIGGELDAGRAKLLFRPAAGGMAIHDVVLRTTEALPDALTANADRVLAALSADGRYLAVVTLHDRIGDHKAELKVLDLHTRTTVTDLRLPPGLHHHVSIDRQGSVLLGSGDRRHEVALGCTGIGRRGSTTVALPKEAGICMLSPDEREVITSGSDTHALVLARRDGGGRPVELRHPTASADDGVWPTSVAFATAKMLVAVAYSDVSVGVFDMRQAGTEMTPAMHHRLGDGSPHQPPVAWFERDGSAINVVHGSRFHVDLTVGTRISLL